MQKNYIILLCLFAPCFISAGISDENDTDRDGLSDAFEIAITNTNPYDQSTDGDPYSDGDEHYGINLPAIKPPGNKSLVAAYPDLNVRLINVTVTPLGKIESATGGSKQSGWSITSEESDSERNSFEWGLEQKVGCNGWQFVGEFGAHQTWVSENTYTTTKSDTSSGWNQEDWSTATTADKDKAAKLRFTFVIKNSGTIPAYNVIPYINIFLGNKPIGTIKSPHPIGTIGIGESTGIFSMDKGMWQGGVEDITVSLDELRIIDSGAPLSIETFQVETWIDIFDAKKGTFDKVPYDSYRNKIKQNAVMLLYRSKDGTYKEYKVHPGYGEKLAPMTLGEAINLTIGSDILENGDERLEYGFFEDDYKEIKEWKQNNANESYINLKLKPGLRILIKEPGDEISPKPPVIHSAWIAKDLRTISASVTDDLGLYNVTAHVKIKGKDEYQDLKMKEYNGNTIYTVISKEEIDKDGKNYIKVIDIEGSSAQFNLPIPTIPTPPRPRKPVLRDGNYIINVKNNRWYMVGAKDGFRVSQDYYTGGSDQIWVLTSDKDGTYSIKNMQTGRYLASMQVGGIVNVQQGLQDQKWNVEQIGEGYYKISNIYNGNCLTFEETKSADSRIVQNKYNENNDNQKLIIQPAGSFPNAKLLTFNLPVDYYLIIAGHSNRCLDLDFKSNIAVQNDYYGNINQKWGLKPVGDGYFGIFNIYNKNCLEVKNSTQNNNPDELQIVVENKYHGGDNQKWNFTYCSDGSYIIFSKSSGKCLTFNRAVGKNDRVTGNDAILAEAKLIEWDAGIDQKWKLLPVTKTAITGKYEKNTYYLTLKQWTYKKGKHWPTPSTDPDCIFELISLGNYSGADIVAIKNFNSYGFIYIGKALPKGIFAPKKGTISLTEVLQNPSNPYNFQLRYKSPTSRSIKSGKYYLDLYAHIARWYDYPLGDTSTYYRLDGYTSKDGSGNYFTFTHLD